MKTKDLIYTNDFDVAWAQRAIDTIQVSASPDAERPILLDLNGRCPRCDHAVEDVHWLITYAGVASMARVDAIRFVEDLRADGTLGSPVLPAEFTVKCNCQHVHPDPLRRKGLKGCGAVWRMRIEKG